MGCDTGEARQVDLVDGDTIRFIKRSQRRGRSAEVGCWRCYHRCPTDLDDRASQCVEPRRVDAIVIGDEDLHEVTVAVI